MMSSDRLAKEFMSGPVNYDEKNDSYYGQIRAELIDFIPEDAKRLLDVGCASGRFGVEVLKHRPEVEVWGIEPMRNAATIAQSCLAHVICNSVEAAIEELPDRHFDCITFNDVLEHLQDPWTVLKRMQTKLAPDGRIVASIPNIRYFPVVKALVLHGDFLYAADGVMDSTHLRFFTRISMERLFSECGFTVTQIVGLKWQRFPILMNLLNRLSGRRFEDMHYMQFAIQARLRHPKVNPTSITLSD